MRLLSILISLAAPSAATADSEPMMVTINETASIQKILNIGTGDGYPLSLKLGNPDIVR